MILYQYGGPLIKLNSMVNRFINPIEPVSKMKPTMPFQRETPRDISFFDDAPHKERIRQGHRHRLRRDRGYQPIYTNNYHDPSNSMAYHLRQGPAYQKVR